MNVHIGNVILLFVFSEGKGINTPVSALQSPYELHNGLTENIRKFSFELLYHTSKAQAKQKNLIISPIAMWTILAATSEGAITTTRRQIDQAIAWSIPNVIRLAIHSKYRATISTIANWLQPRTETIDLVKINAIFVDSKKSPLQEFSDTALKYDDTKFVAIDFKKCEDAAKIVNKVISKVTDGKIPKLVDSSSFSDSEMVLASASYFKGEFTFSFNRSNTARAPFYNSKGNKIGEVNMMYKRDSYAFANIKELGASVIELPYGRENRFSMLVMLPHPGVLLESIFSNFVNVTLDSLLEELRSFKEDYGDNEVDCYIPRFRIESDLDMTDTLKNSFGIIDVFDESKAELPFMANFLLHISKVIHKTQIEVSDDYTIASGAATSNINSNRFGVVRFEANRPFTYMIIERTTHTIVFGGFYREP